MKLRMDTRTKMKVIEENMEKEIDFEKYRTLNKMRC
jgi:hypothetical protein